MKKLVSCGIMYDKNGNILLGKRPKQKENNGYWEFPGGKRENDETLHECLKREWKEELNLDIEINKYIAYNEDEKYICHFFKGNILYEKDIIDIDINIHDKIGFFNPEELKELKLFDEDMKIINLLKK